VQREGVEWREVEVALAKRNSLVLTYTATFLFLSSLFASTVNPGTLFSTLLRDFFSQRSSVKKEVVEVAKQRQVDLLTHERKFFIVNNLLKIEGMSNFSAPTLSPHCSIFCVTISYSTINNIKVTYLKYP
jgi:hypothetical protein